MNLDKLEINIYLESYDYRDCHIYIYDFIDFFNENLYKSDIYDKKDIINEIIILKDIKEHNLLMKKLRIYEVKYCRLLNIYDYANYRRDKVLFRNQYISYIDFLIKNINDNNQILFLENLKYYKHYETIKEKLKPIEEYLKTSLQNYLNNK